MPPAVVSRLRHLDHGADVGDVLALGDQLLGGFQLAVDLLGRMPGAFHGRVTGPVWPAEDSHSPWTYFQGPCHRHWEGNAWVREARVGGSYLNPSGLTPTRKLTNLLRQNNFFDFKPVASSFP